MNDPDPQQMISFCRRQLPRILTQPCQVDDGLAYRIGADVLTRAEAFAALPQHVQDVLVAPFVEEVFDHNPPEASLDLKATVTVVVRNSLLEQAHHDGPLGSGVLTITTLAAGPLSHLLAARRRASIAPEGPDPFTDLPVRYRERGPAWTP